MVAQSDPHLKRRYFSAVGDDQISISVADGALIFSRPADPFTTGDENGVIFWAKGETITRIAYDIKVSAALTSFENRVWRGTGPAGAMTAEATTHNVSSNISVDHTLATPGDMIALTLRCTANVTPGVANK